MKIYIHTSSASRIRQKRFGYIEKKRNNNFDIQMYYNMYYVMI